jgi:hypothetical protein
MFYHLLPTGECLFEIAGEEFGTDCRPSILFLLIELIQLHRVRVFIASSSLFDFAFMSEKSKGGKENSLKFSKVSNESL